MDRGTLHPVARVPRDSVILPSQLNITDKYDSNGKFEKIKGRLVATGKHVDRAIYDDES
jgi:hypothetical protein